MTREEIYNELKSKMGDDRAVNEAMLRKEAERFAREKNELGFKTAGELIVENMDDDKRDEIVRIIHIDGIRLDEYYDKIDKLVTAREMTEAKALAEKLYKKITVEFKEGEKAKFVSFRNPFEDNLYQYLYKDEKILTRAPFDFAMFITTYAYIVFETGSPLDAIPILEKAIEFNPVDCGPKFELAEVYKRIRNKKRLIEITQETLKVASSPIALSRCYANMGYMLTDFQEYEDAAVFYTASVMCAPDPSIPREMQHLADLKGSPVKYSGREKVVEVLEKYGMSLGPSVEVITVAAQLASHYLAQKDIENALMALKLTYNLTHDETIKELILKYDPEAPMAVYAGEKADEEGKPNITRTVNQSPEE